MQNENLLPFPGIPKALQSNSDSFEEDTNPRKNNKHSQKNNNNNNNNNKSRKSSKKNSDCSTSKIEKPIAIKPNSSSGFRPASLKKESLQQQQQQTPQSFQKLEDSLNSINNTNFTPNYSPFHMQGIFEPRNCEFPQLDFGNFPQQLAMMMSYKMMEAFNKPQQPQANFGMTDNNLMSYFLAQNMQQQFLQQHQNMMQQQQQNNNNSNISEQIQQQQELSQELSQQQIQQQQQQPKKILKKRIQKPKNSGHNLNEKNSNNNSNQNNNNNNSVSSNNLNNNNQGGDRSKEQQKKEREETKNILRNTGNAIKNFHKENECREILLKLLDNDEELFNRYYSNFLPQKLEKFEDFQEIWHVEGQDEITFKLKKAFRNICWTFMESYFFQYFFHKSRCQKESLRALVKFRHRFMEGLIDPECFHYFKKITQR